MVKRKVMQFMVDRRVNCGQQENNSKIYGQAAGI